GSRRTMTQEPNDDDHDHDDHRTDELRDAVHAAGGADPAHRRRSRPGRQRRGDRLRRARATRGRRARRGRAWAARAGLGTPRYQRTGDPGVGRRVPADRPAESDYHTLAGTVRVMRTVYRKTERNGDTLDPVSVRAGVVADGWLPHTARAMAHLLAQGT